MKVPRALPNSVRDAVTKAHVTALDKSIENYTKGIPKVPDWVDQNYRDFDIQETATGFSVFDKGGNLQREFGFAPGDFLNQEQKHLVAKQSAEAFVHGGIHPDLNVPASVASAFQSAVQRNFAQNEAPVAIPMLAEHNTKIGSSIAGTPTIMINQERATTPLTPSQQFGVASRLDVGSFTGEQTLLYTMLHEAGHVFDPERLNPRQAANNRADVTQKFLHGVRNFSDRGDFDDDDARAYGTYLGYKMSQNEVHADAFAISNMKWLAQNAVTPQVPLLPPGNPVTPNFAAKPLPEGAPIPGVPGMTRGPVQPPVPPLPPPPFIGPSEPDPGDEDWRRMRGSQFVQGADAPRAPHSRMVFPRNPGDGSPDTTGIPWTVQEAPDNSAYSLESLFSGIDEETRNALGMRITDDVNGRQVIRMSQTLGSGTQASVEDFDIARDQKTGMITVNRPDSPAGGFVVTGEIDLNNGARTDNATVLNQLLGRAARGDNDPESGRQMSFSRILQTRHSSPYVFFNELTAQSRAKWGSSFKVSDTIRDTETGKDRPRYASDMLPFMENNRDLIYRGSGSHVFGARQFESSNFPVDEQGRVYYGKSAKRGQQQGVHETLDRETVMGIRDQKMMMPARFSGQTTASTGYRVRTAIDLHGGVLVPEGAGLISKDSGYVGRQNQQITKLNDKQLALSKTDEWKARYGDEKTRAEAIDELLGYRSGDVFNFGHDDPMSMRTDDRFRGRVSSVPGLPKSEAGSYSHMRIGDVQLDLEAGTANTTFTKYIPTSQASAKISSKEHLMPVDPRSGLLDINVVGKGKRSVDILRAAPGENDAATLALNAMLTEAGTTGNLYRQFSQHLMTNYRMGDDGALLAAGDKGFDDGRALTQRDAKQLFSPDGEAGVIGGRNVRVYDSMARDFLRNRWEVAQFSDRRISQDVLDQYGSFDENGNFVGRENNSFEHGGQAYDILSNVRRQDDGSYLADYTTQMAFFDKMERFRPEFDRGVHMLRPEMLDNMAIANPGLYSNLRARDAAGEFTNYSRDIIRSTLANVNPEAMENLRASGGVVDFNQIGYAEAINQVDQGLDADEATMALMKALAAGEHGDKAVQIGDIVLPSARAALSTITQDDEGRIVKTFGREWSRAMAAAQTVEDASALGMSDADALRNRDIASYDAMVQAAALADRPSTIQSAYGIEMPMLGGPAIAAQGLAANEIVMSQRQLFQMAGVYNYEGEEREAAKAMALQAAQDGTLSFNPTMFPHTNPDIVYPNLKISMLEDVKRREGMGWLSEVEGNFWMSPELAMYFRKDLDADTVFGWLSRSIGKSKDGALGWIGDALGITDASVIREHAQKTKEYQDLVENAQATLSDFMGGVDKSRDPEAAKTTIRSFEEITQGASGFIGYKDIVQAKAQIGQIYNMGIRGHSAFSRALGEMYENANPNDDKARQANRTYSEAMSYLGEYAYQKGADYEVINDPAIKALQAISQSLTFDSSRVGGKRSSYINIDGEPMEVPGSDSLHGLSKWVIEQAAGYGITQDDYMEKVAPHLAHALLPLNKQDDQDAYNQMLGLLGDYKETGKLDINALAETAGYKAQNIAQMVFGKPGGDKGDVIPFLRFQGAAAINNMMKRADSGKNSAGDKYRGEGALPEGSGIGQGLMRAINAFTDFRKGEKGIVQAIKSVFGSPEELYKHSREAVRETAGESIMEQTASLSEQVARQRPASYGGTTVINGEEYNTVDLGGDQQHLINPKYDTNPSLSGQRFSNAVPASMWGFGGRNGSEEERALARATSMVTPKAQQEAVQTKLGINKYIGRGSANNAAEKGTRMHEAFQSSVLPALGMTPEEGVTHERFVNNADRLSYGYVDAVLPGADGQGVVSDMKTMSERSFQGFIDNGFNFQDQYGAQLGIYVEGAQQAGGAMTFTDASGQKQTMGISGEMGALIPVIAPSGDPSSITPDVLRQQMSESHSRLVPAMTAARDAALAGEGAIPEWFKGDHQAWAAHLNRSLDFMQHIQDKTGMAVPAFLLSQTGEGGMAEMLDSMMEGIQTLSESMPVHDRSVTNQLSAQQAENIWSSDDIASFIRGKMAGDSTSLGGRPVAASGGTPPPPPPPAAPPAAAAAGGSDDDGKGKRKRPAVTAMAKAAAEAAGISLAGIKGTGPDGQITIADVRRNGFAGQPDSVAPTPAAAGGQRHYLDAGGNSVMLPYDPANAEAADAAYAQQGYKPAPISEAGGETIQNITQIMQPNRITNLDGSDVTNARMMGSRMERFQELVAKSRGSDGKVSIGNLSDAEQAEFGELSKVYGKSRSALGQYQMLLADQNTANRPTDEMKAFRSEIGGIGGDLFNALDDSDLAAAVGEIDFQMTDQAMTTRVQKAGQKMVKSQVSREDELGVLEAGKRLSGLRDTLKEFADQVSNTDKIQKDHVQTVKQLTGLWEDLTKIGKKVSETPDNELTAEDRAVKEVLYGSQGLLTQHGGDLERIARANMGIQMGNIAVVPGDLSDEEHQVRMQEAIFGRGKTGRKARAGLTDEDYERGLDTMFGEIKGRRNVEMFGTAMRGVDAIMQPHTQFMIRHGMSMIDQNIKRADAFGDTLAGEQITMASAGAISMDALDSGAFGQQTRRRGSLSLMNRQMGRAAYDAFSPFLDVAANAVGGARGLADTAVLGQNVFGAGMAAAGVGSALSAAGVVGAGAASMLALPAAGIMAGAHLVGLGISNQRDWESVGRSQLGQFDIAGTMGKWTNYIGRAGDMFGASLRGDESAFQTAYADQMRGMVSGSVMNMVNQGQSVNDILNSGQEVRQHFWSPKGDTVRFGDLFDANQIRGMKFNKWTEDTISSLGVDTGATPNFTNQLFGTLSMFDENVALEGSADADTTKRVGRLTQMGIDTSKLALAYMRSRGQGIGDRQGSADALKRVTDLLYEDAPGIPGLSADKNVREIQLGEAYDLQANNPMRGALGLAQLSDQDAVAMGADTLQGQLYRQFDEWQIGRASTAGYRGSNLDVMGNMARAAGNVSMLQRVMGIGDVSAFAAQSAMRRGADFGASRTGMENIMALVAGNETLSGLGGEFQKQVSAVYGMTDVTKATSTPALENLGQMFSRNIDTTALLAARASSQTGIARFADMEKASSDLRARLESGSLSQQDLVDYENETLFDPYRRAANKGRELSGRGRRNFSAAQIAQIMSSDATAEAFTTVSGMADASAAAQDQFYQANRANYARLEAMASTDPASAINLSGQMRDSQAMYQGYVARGADAAQMARVTGQAAMTLDSNSFNRWKAAAGGDAIVLSQLARGGHIGGEFETIDLETGADAYRYNLNPAEKRRIKDYAKQYGLEGMTTSLDDITSTRQAEETIRQRQVEFQTYQYEQEVESRQIQRSVTSAGARGTRDLDSQGFVKIGDGLKALAEVFEKRGLNFDAGNGMSMWQIEDRQTQIGREKQQFGIQQQTQNLGLQQAQFDLAGKHFYEKYNLDVEQFEYNTGYQRREMGIQRRQSLTQRQWQREDMAFQRDQAEVSFGWEQEDFDRNIRYARGRERQDLLRQKERSVIQHSMQMGQMDRQENRFDQSSRWQDAQFKREQEKFEKSIEFTKREMEMRVRHFEEGRALDKQRLDMQKQAHDREIGWMKEIWGLEDQRRKIDRQMYDLDIERSDEMLAKSRDLEVTTRDLGNAIAIANEQLGAQNAKTALLAATGVLANLAFGGLNSELGKTPTKAAEVRNAIIGMINDLTGAINSAKSQAASIQSYSGGSTTAKFGNSQNFMSHGGFADNAYAMAYKGQEIKEFAGGGYTGDGMKYEAAGVVHKGEYVVPQNGALVIRGDNSELVALMRQAVRLLEKIASTPAHVEATIHTNQKAVRVGDFTAKDKVASRLPAN